MPSFLRAVLHSKSVRHGLGLALAGFLLGALGCSVNALDSSAAEATANECQDDGDCKGGVCVADRCRAKQGFFSTLLVEVSSPASAAPDFAGVSYLHRLEVNINGGRSDIVLARPVAVTGRVSFEPYAVGIDGTCPLSFVGDDPTNSVLASSDGIPVSISFTPSDRILGVASTKYDVEIDVSKYERVAPTEAAPVLPFNLKVPPGEYDIYIRPRATTAGGCEIPPTLLRRAEVPQAIELDLDLDLPPPASFALTIKWPKGNGQPALEGWTVDMLDPLTGLVISTKAVLTKLDPDSYVEYEEYEEYGARLSYTPVTLEEAEGERVRLAPPEGVDAPTIVLDRSVLELFTPGTGMLDSSSPSAPQYLGLPEPVTIEGQLTLAGAAEPSPGTVTVVSTSIEGVVEGVFASFVRSVDADADGNFTMRLLPGTYRVYAWPGSSGMAAGASLPAASQTEWEIAAEPELQAGKTVELLPAVHVTGIANLLRGEPASGSTVIAIASPRDILVDPLTQAAQGNLAIAPAAQSAIVSGDGFFDVLADPGVFDISVRPPDGSGFAWYVASQVHVQPAATPELMNHDVGNYNLPLPVPYSGRVVVPYSAATSVPIAEALLRAYVYLDEANAYTGDPTRAVSVVQIGETRADADGNFELLIPANLN